MSTPIADINAALDAQLYTLSSSPPVAWENISYTPVLGATWIRPTLLPGDVIAATYENDIYIGIYQVSIFAPAGSGKSTAVTLADRIGDLFKPVTEITYNTRVVRCMSVSVARAQEENGWYHLPVEIKYLSTTIKRT